MTTHSKNRTLSYAAMFLALAYLFPFITGQLPQLGSMLCPMHFPVLLCGFLCGWKWGMLIGFTSPFLRSVTLGTPILFPMAVCMSFELAAYGATAGLLYRRLPKCRGSVYLSLVCAMIVGRLVWGAAMFFSMALSGGGFGLHAFLAAAITNALPGILLQLILLPPLVFLLDRFQTT